MTQNPGDTVTIDAVHPESRFIAMTFNIGGVTYPQVIPMVDTQDAAVLTAQIQQLGQQMRAGFAALTAAVQAADASGAPSVSTAVTSLVGTSIPVDVPPPSA